MNHKNKNNKKHFSSRLALLVGLSLFLITLSIAGFAQSRVARLSSQTWVPSILGRERPVSLEAHQKEDGPSTVLFFGDMMLGRGVAAKMSELGGAASFDYVREVLGEPDYVVANLEGPISDRGTNVGSKYSFRFVPEAAVWIAGAGIDLVSTANNHAWDWGRDALCDTPALLEAQGVASVGTGCDEVSANEPHVVSLGDSRLLFMSYTNLYPSGLTARGDIPGVSDLNLARISRMITEFKKEDGIVVLLMHWGEEYQTRSHPIQQSWAHDLIDAGADLIIGHHPHVTQEIERYGDGWIVYSLGNFIFDQYFSEETMRGFGVEFELSKNEVLGFSVKPYSLNSLYQPVFGDSEK